MVDSPLLRHLRTGLWTVIGLSVASALIGGTALHRAEEREARTRLGVGTAVEHEPSGDEKQLYQRAAASGPQRAAAATRVGLTVRHDLQGGTITVFRPGSRQPLITNTVSPDRRPYLHRIAAPDGRSLVRNAELFWAFTSANGRDYVQMPGAGAWRRVSATVLQPRGDEVRWQTIYDLLDTTGKPVLTQTERWSMRERDGAFVLDVEWRGEAKTDVTVGKDGYAGLLVRVPWGNTRDGEVVNAARQRNERADAQRAMWIDIATPVGGRDDPVHVAIFDHPDNTGYPQAWRVQPGAGVGSLRSRTADWTIAKGQTEILRHRVLVYTGRLNDVEMTSAWAEFTGNPSMSTAALWGIAQREGREEKFLTPDQAAAQMTLVDGFAVNVWASEPTIAQPMAFCWDDRGRLWIAENKDYESRVKGFSNAGTSRILILEDTNRDGVADTRKVFMDGIVFPAALAVGFDGVFVGAPPNLLFVPDKDGDDKADLNDIEVRLTGWGIQDRHETLNSLHWGPDGWLYGLQGYATSSKIRKPSGKGRVYKHKDPFPEDVLSGEGVEINGGVWRYHPTKEIFEVVAHGFSNPWGIDYDAKGQLLISACVIPHLWHVVPGGIYHRQGGQHFNPYVYDDIQTIADHRHRSAHGGARVYQSDAFPASQHGRIFMANIHEHAVLSDVLVRRGSGFTARHGDDFLLANNAQWIGFSVEIGPDGALYVLDWHDGDICGMDVLHYETGRVFRIAPRQSRAAQWDGRYSDLRKMTDLELVELQTNPSDWHARRARVILQHRAARGGVKREAYGRLRDMFRSTLNPDWRLRAMWTLHVTGGWTPEALIQVLGDGDEYVRAWAVQLLCEDRSPSPDAIAKFATMAREDSSPIVRLYLASALQRIDRSARWDVASGLMTRAEDATDHNLPKMVWLGVEPLVADNAAVALEHASRSAIPLVARSIARRSVDAGALEPLVAAIGRSPATLVSLLEGMRDGLDGRFDVAAPPNWTRVRAELKSVRGPAARLLQDVAQQFGDIETARSNLASVRNRAAGIEERRSALRILAAQRRPELVAELSNAIDDEGVRIEAIRAVAAFDDQSLGKLLIARYGTFSNAEKMEAVQTLASRRSYGLLLAEAIAADRVPRRDIPLHVARQLFRVVGAGFTDVWGPIDQSVAHEKLYARYRRMLNDTAMRSANLENGRARFKATCGTCHKLYGEGGAIGPDLTGSNRSNLDYVLFNVLDPNGDVPEAYKMVLVTTRDGRTFAGNVIAETDTQLTLRVVDRDPVVISKSNIQTREATSTSMMPPGLFETLRDRDVIDLVAYLRTMGPVRARAGSGAKP